MEMTNKPTEYTGSTLEQFKAWLEQNRQFNVLVGRKWVACSDLLGFLQALAGKTLLEILSHILAAAEANKDNPGFVKVGKSDMNAKGLVLFLVLQAWNSLVSAGDAAPVCELVKQLMKDAKPGSPLHGEGRHAMEKLGCKPAAK
ncbi:MAG: hypothetical protein HY519_01180 [Candidatus Aenigmarchaeota archaeon]|nr:hypothetical protein [Candidatus Aenigmarchaeota archaeon]